MKLEYRKQKKELFKLQSKKGRPKAKKRIPKKPKRRSRGARGARGGKTEDQKKEEDVEEEGPTKAEKKAAIMKRRMELEQVSIQSDAGAVIIVIVIFIS